MKYYVSALIATAVFAQFTPSLCCYYECPRDPRCIGCEVPCNDEASPIDISVSDMTALIGGVLAGAKIQSVDDLATCIKDADPLVAHIFTAADDFDDGSVDKMNEGVKELGNFYAQLATDMEGCGKLSSDDVTLLKNISDAFLNPKTP